MKWKELAPDARLIAALESAGAVPETGQDAKRHWGTLFANACAVMFADAIRANPAFRGLEIRPNPDGSGTESLTGVGGGKQKKVDVIASTLTSGLQVAISLKAENFPDAQTGTYGKNLTNRLYELQDEVRAIHEYQPKAYVVGVFFLPLDATSDRKETSSFSRAVAQLRARSERLDPALASHLNRLDASYVGLYVPAETEHGHRGVVRYFNVRNPPPRVGRPKIEGTLALEGLIEQIADALHQEAGGISEYSDPEED